MNVRNQVARNLRVAKGELRQILAAKRRKVGAKVFLRSGASDDVAARAALVGKEPAAKLDFFRRRRAHLGDIAEQVRIRELAGDVLHHLVQVFVRPLIPGHLAVLQIGLRVAQPVRQPICIHFAADFGQLRANVAADQLRLSSAGDGQRMAGGAKHQAETRLALIG